MSLDLSAEVTTDSAMDSTAFSSESTYDDSTLILISKITALIIITAITLLCGLIPLICTTCRRSTKVLGLANAFSGGLFMGIALFHLLPESNEHFEEYFLAVDPDSLWKRLPCSFFIAFISYSLILFIEKVAFDSHSLTEHDHGGHHAQHHPHISHKSYGDLVENNPELTETLLDKNESGHRDRLVATAILKNMNPIEEKEGENETEDHNERGLSSKQERGRPNVISKMSSSSSIHNLRPIDLTKKSSMEFGRKRNVSDIVDNSNKNSLADEMLLGHRKRIEKGYEEDEDEPESTESEREDDDEQTMKNVVSSKGKFASYLHARNIMQSPMNNVKVDRSLFTASKILERAQARRQGSIDRNCITNLPYPRSSKGSVRKPSGDKGEVNESEKVFTITATEDHVHLEVEEKHHFHPKSNLTPYLLLVALSIHGLFEGTALGVQRNFRDAVFLALAIIAHKWAEAFTLGISFSKSSLDSSSFIRMILLFAIFTPVGILSGMILTTAGSLMQAIFLAISSGTFIYISASEVIVEEFAVTKYRYQKFFFYLCGGILVGLLSYLEVE